MSLEKILENRLLKGRLDQTKKDPWVNANNESRSKQNGRAADLRETYGKDRVKGWFRGRAL